jgi:hypothetical protein
MSGKDGGRKKRAKSDTPTAKKQRQSRADKRENLDWSISQSRLMLVIPNGQSTFKFEVNRNEDKKADTYLLSLERVLTEFIDADIPTRHYDYLQLHAFMEPEKFPEFNDAYNNMSTECGKSFYDSGISVDHLRSVIDDSELQPLFDTEKDDANFVFLPHVIYAIAIALRQLCSYDAEDDADKQLPEIYFTTEESFLAAFSLDEDRLSDVLRANFDCLFLALSDRVYDDSC